MPKPTRTRSGAAALAVGGLLLALTACAAAERADRGAAADPTRVTIGESHTLASSVYAADRTINVSLPWSYDETPNARYPVLYLVDGGVEQDFVPLAGMAALASLTGQFREFILVGVQTENRQVELTSPSTLEQDLEWLPQNGGAAAFRRHVLDEVRPFIDARFRTSDESAILGESLAGLFIVETFLLEPSSFTHFLAVSPSLWWKDQDLTRRARERLDAGRPSFANRSLFLTIADEGDSMQDGMDRLVAALRATAPDELAWTFRPMADEQHHTIYNPAALRALRMVFAPLD